MKKVIKLNESEFRYFIAESVARLLKEDELMGDVPLDDSDVPEIPETDDVDNGSDWFASPEEQALAADEIDLEPSDENLNDTSFDDELSGIVSEAIKRVLTDYSHS